METLNVFDNISEHIIKHIKNAENAIYICVPWLTDEKILIELVEKTKQNVHIEIITLNDEFNRLKSKYFNKLISNGSKVYFIDKTAQGGIPHLKFCVIDDEILITGSYNWSNNARKNDENILISAHGNSIRALCKFLFKLDSQKITLLEIPTGNPLLISLDLKQNIKECSYLDQDRAKDLLVF